MATILTCDICPRACKLEEAKTGFCNVRKNVNGENVDALRSLVCMRSEGPTHHSLYLPGCNLQCAGCFVPFISRYRAGSRLPKVSTTEPVDFAVKHQKLLTFIGGEPTLHYEYVLEASQLCRSRGGVCDLYTNGYASQRIVSALSKAVDQVHVGVKASASRKVYDRVAADPAIVLESVRTAWRENGDVWVRNLVGPELSPTYEESVSFATWLLDNVDLEIPVIVEPMLQPLDHFPLHGYPPAAGDDVWQMFKRCIGVASTLHTSGLSNVWVIEYVTHPPSMCASRFPSFEPIRFLDFMPERYRALGYPNRQIE